MEMRVIDEMMVMVGWLVGWLVGVNDGMNK